MAARYVRPSKTLCPHCHVPLNEVTDTYTGETWTRCPFDDCRQHDVAGEPCWGDVAVAVCDQTEDDHYDTSACSGHYDQVASEGVNEPPYKPEPPKV